MNCLLTSAIKRCEFVPPGIARILVTNWDDNLVFLHDNSRPFIYVDILNVNEWYDITPQGAGFNVQKQDNNNGNLYLETLDLEIPGIDFSKTENADLLSRGKFLFIIRTVHGYNQMLGVHASLKMRSFRSAAGESENSYQISFRGMNIKMAPYVLDDYVKAIPDNAYSSGFTPGFS